MKPLLNLLIFLIGLSGSILAQNAYRIPCPTINKLYTTAVVKSLSSDYFEGRDIERKSIARSTNYMINILKNNKLEPFNGRYLHTFNIMDNVNSDNVLAFLNKNKKSKDVILLVANYDNLGVKYENIYTDSVYNGANDNATGVCAVFQIGRFFQRANLNENFILAFTTGRRFGYSGIGKVIDEIQNEGYNIKFAINFERLGVPLSPGNHELILYEGMPSNLPDILDTLDPGHYINVKPFENSWLDHSRTEHGLMYNLLKVPTFTITSFNYENDNSFMTPKDEFEHIDLDFLYGSISIVSETLFYFLANKLKPTLINNTTSYSQP